MKKTKKAVALTPDEQAVERCERIKVLTLEIESRETELKDLKQEQITYMFAQKLTANNGFSLIETAGKSVLGGLTGKALTVAKERLLSMIDGIYIKKTLDDAKITASVESDDALFGQLTKSGLKIEQSEPTYSLRVVREK